MTALASRNAPHAAGLVTFDDVSEPESDAETFRVVISGWARRCPPFASGAMCGSLICFGGHRRRILPTAAERTDEVDAGAQLQGIEIERL